MPKKRVPSRAAKAQAPWRLRTKLMWCLGVAVLGAAIADVAIVWDQQHTVPTEKFVKVYREHGCTCVFAWVKSLEAEGYIVRVFEPETLPPTRSALHMPKRSWGCHVAEFMGYFVEGHVPGAVLGDLSRQHPRALGVALTTDAAVPERAVTVDGAAGGKILLFDGAGNSRRWESAIRPALRKSSAADENTERY